MLEGKCEFSALRKIVKEINVLQEVQKILNVVKHFPHQEDV